MEAAEWDASSEEEQLESNEAYSLFLCIIDLVPSGRLRVCDARKSQKGLAFRRLKLQLTVSHRRPSDLWSSIAGPGGHPSSHILHFEVLAKLIGAKEKALKELESEMMKFKMARWIWPWGWGRWAKGAAGGL
uniref:HDC14461 n=1 Tax=Drosophila melanogaster TaxID=7227 RepID=Q6IJQ2_DROME|nr:TPA_inf: HDC14461 [Drosophila melanogaster]